MRLKKIFKISVALILISVAAILICDSVIKNSSKDFLYNDVTSIPYNKVGLLLGTSKYTSNGYTNLYYKYRIEGATQLMNAGKIKYLIISGDNRKKNYNEPKMMRTDLINAGIDSTKIILDYAGFRTFDSVVRAREVFGQETLTFISQRFHNERAIYIASKEDIMAMGFNVSDVHANYGFKTNLREKLARVKVFLDFMIGTQPKFLGNKIKIPD